MLAGETREEYNKRIKKWRRIRNIAKKIGMVYYISWIFLPFLLFCVYNIHMAFAKQDVPLEIIIILSFLLWISYTLIMILMKD